MRAAALLLALATLAAPHTLPPGGRAGASRARAVAPLVAPAVGRCTSDGACTSTDEEGVVRRGSRVRYPG